ncbi:hypothetical protein [Ferviditalea candida]|uniref:Uncharacterized protein n=1 Tax=Ferviditalea candida TaxID=3108399 RepID=A0ABU5ZIM4_9BACL|nr:hypothetical protein [Paenibacillaceae bacterium T2]
MEQGVMEQSVFWIFGVFAVGMLWVHVSHYHFKRGNRQGKHYVLITRDNQLTVEWVIRSLFLYYGLKGEPFRITVLDEQSQDDTRSIIARLTDPQYVRVHGMASVQELRRFANELKEEGAIIVNLNHPQDLSKMPSWV